MDQAVGFDEVRWLRELTYKTQKGEIPEIVGAKLLRLSVGAGPVARGASAAAIPS